MDLLWSGTKDEKRLNYESKNCSDDEIDNFLEANCLEMLINTRDGLARGVDDETHHTLSVFSATNFANSNNKACVLRINKNFNIAPLLIEGSPTKKSLWVCDVPIKSNLTFNPAETEVRNCMFKA